MTATDPRVPPPWARDLVIYELNPRTFTSPHGSGDGSGSGTFASMAERFPYLKDLGVNGVWMAGHHLATTHFYGIWTVYATLDPTVIDPSLGTPQDLKAMVQAAHAAGIRVFLDVISHGVLHESWLVTEHPDWFTSSSWGMADYDYENPEFRAWWTDLWVNYAREYDVDGFRIDVAMGDIRLWDTIVETVAADGKHIVVFPENERYHFSQQDRMGVDPNPVRTQHIHDFLGQQRGLSTAQLSCHDYGWESLPGNHYYLKGSRARAVYGAFLGPVIPLLYSGDEFDATPTPLPLLTQGLFGTGGPGGWLYGNQLDWTQIEQPDKAAMLADVTRMLALRREYSHLVHADKATALIVAVPHDGATSLYPYALGDHGREALIVLANDEPRNVTTRIRLPLADLGFEASASVELLDVVTGEPIAIHGADADVTIQADYTPGGGYRVLHLTQR